MASRTTLTARRAVRTLSHRSLDWSSPVFKGDPELAAAVSNFRGWVSQAEAMEKKYAAPPTPIDFAGAKEAARDKELISSLESMYSSAKPAPETFAWDPADKAEKEQQVVEAESRMAMNQEMIEDTEKEIEFMKANRTTLDTNALHLGEAYPDIDDEIHEEMKNREWFKDHMVVTKDEDDDE
eukprot:CAMPEP_0194026028 /NCGR_PEP_ID=MMETSP0009_2-20130614/347_1 /TAXON_ID=210454 /ORGANISM="Grammatophora oceanica, Strain CCMP 410" /LENGTH=181 /DNA_ID=CAMNT_0038664507 /DNA_START=27 /DNA_END=572 /DNA_ORIENTATION=+